MFLSPLTSRNLSLALSQRVVENLDFARAAYVPTSADPPLPRIHLVTQILAAAPVILNLPFDDISVPRRQLDETPLPRTAESAREALTLFFPIPSLQIHHWHGANTIGAFLHRLQSGIAAYQMDFHGDDSNFPDPDRLVVTIFDGFRIADWKISLTATDLENLLRAVAARTLNA